MSDKKKKILKQWFSFLYIILLLWLFSKAMLAYMQKKIQENPVVVISNSTWANVEILTWELLTWEEVPEKPREYLNYILKNWVAGIDYIMIAPPKPPIIHSSDKEENNKVMKSYLARTKIDFTIPKTDKKGYVMFVSEKEIPETRDLFLSINWWVIWAIRKDKSLPISELNEYLYAMDSIVIAWTNWKTKNLYDYVVNEKLWLNGFVWEKGNYIKEIILFWK